MHFANDIPALIERENELITKLFTSNIGKDLKKNDKNLSDKVSYCSKNTWDIEHKSPYGVITK